MKTTKSKATRELAIQCDNLKKQIDDILSEAHISDELMTTLNELSSRLTDLYDDYDWFDTEFEENGKKGLHNVKGEVVVPALYDSFVEYPAYYIDDTNVVAMKDGLCGIVKRDGTGAPVTAFEYADIQSIPYTHCFFVSKPEDPKHYAVMMSGQIFTPFEITAFTEPCDGWFGVRKGDKKGLFSLGTLDYVSPEYDEIYDEGDGSFIIFEKDGQEGRLTTEGRFVSNAEYDALTTEEQDELDFLTVDD